MAHAGNFFINNAGSAGLTGSFMTLPPYGVRRVFAFNST